MSTYLKSSAASGGPRPSAAAAQGPLAVCVPVAARTPAGMVSGVDGALAAGADLAEARLDYIGARAIPRALELLSAGARGRRRMERLVCTVRSGREGGRFRGDERGRIELLGLAASHRPHLLDVEYDALRRSGGSGGGRLRDAAADAGAEILASWHDYGGTPTLRSLSGRLERMGALARHVKIVTTAVAPTDPARVLSLYGAARRMARGRSGRGGGGGGIRLVAFAMGEMGRMSRVLCLYLGSPHTYASLDGRRGAVAPGQMSLADVLAATGRRSGRPSRQAARGPVSLN